MKLSPFAAALAFAAVPLSAQSTQEDDVSWDTEELQAMVLECGSLVSQEDCLTKAKQDAQKYKVPMFVIYHNASGQTGYFQIKDNKIEPAHEEDVRTIINLDDGDSWEAPSPSQPALTMATP